VVGNPNPNRFEFHRSFPQNLVPANFIPIGITTRMSFPFCSTACLPGPLGAFRQPIQIQTLLRTRQSVGDIFRSHQLLVPPILAANPHTRPTFENPGRLQQPLRFLRYPLRPRKKPQPPPGSGLQEIRGLATAGYKESSSRHQSRAWGPHHSPGKIFITPRQILTETELARCALSSIQPST